MISAILYSIGSACFGVAFVHSGIPSKITRRISVRSGRYLSGKPFTCEMCMGWWSGIASGIYFVKDPVEVIYIGAMSFVLAVAITKHLNR